MATVILILIVIALVVGVVGLIQSRGTSLPSWGVSLLAVALLLGRLA